MSSLWTSRGRRFLVSRSVIKMCLFVTSLEDQLDQRIEFHSFSVCNGRNKLYRAVSGTRKMDHSDFRSSPCKGNPNHYKSQQLLLLVELEKITDRKHFVTLVIFKCKLTSSDKNVNLKVSRKLTFVLYACYEIKSWRTRGETFLNRNNTELFHVGKKWDCNVKFE